MANKFICYRCGACGGGDKIKLFKILYFSAAGAECKCKLRLCGNCAEVFKNLKFKMEVIE